MAPEDDADRIRDIGGRLLLTRDSMALAPGLATTGEVTRTTDFETVGMDLWTIVNGRTEADIMADDISVVARVAGRDPGSSPGAAMRASSTSVAGPWT